MSRSFGFQPDARLEFREAVRFYQSQGRGVGAELVKEVRSAVDHVLATSLLWRSHISVAGPGIGGNGLAHKRRSGVVAVARRLLRVISALRLITVARCTSADNITAAPRCARLAAPRTLSSAFPLADIRTLQRLGCLQTSFRIIQDVGLSIMCIGRHRQRTNRMKSFTAVIEKDAQTGLFVGYIPGFPGAHSRAIRWKNSTRTCKRCSNSFSKMVNLSSKPNSWAPIRSVSPKPTLLRLICRDVRLTPEEFLRHRE